MAGCTRRVEGPLSTVFADNARQYYLVRHTPAMTIPDYSDVTARVLDGEALRCGELYWLRPEPPLLMERATLVSQAMPPGTLAAGHTAGWVWTGMGVPTPLSLIAQKSPAPSPLARHRWKIRGVKVSPSNTTVLGPLALLTPAAAQADLWTCPALDEVAASQLFWLEAAEPTENSGASERRMALIDRWRENYPWATRYTS